jgi:hypothetical protein
LSAAADNAQTAAHRHLTEQHPWPRTRQD